MQCISHPLACSGAHRALEQYDEVGIKGCPSCLRIEFVGIQWACSKRHLPMSRMWCLHYMFFTTVQSVSVEAVNYRSLRP